MIVHGFGLLSAHKIGRSAPGRPRRRTLWVLAALCLACGPVDARPKVAVSRDRAATALLSGMGLAAHLDAADAAGRASLWLLEPAAALPAELPREAIVVRVDRSRLDPVFAAARAIGAALDAREAAEQWVRSVQLGFAGISAASLGEPRPHVGVVLAADPVVLAGGTSLETELVEIAGAESVTHGGETLRVSVDGLPPEHTAPDLWLWIAAAHPTREAWARARSQLPGDALLDVFVLPDTWLEDPVAHAARLRTRVAAIPTPAATPAR